MIFSLAHNQNASGAGGFEAAAGGTATGHIHSGSKANFSNTDIGSTLTFYSLFEIVKITILWIAIIINYQRRSRRQSNL